jgi:hypothetical protein
MSQLVTEVSKANVPNNKIKKEKVSSKTERITYYHGKQAKDPAIQHAQAGLGCKLSI